MYYFVEPMIEDDIAQVQEIERESYSLRWSTSTYRRELRQSSTSRYLVARASHRPPPPVQSGTGFPRRVGYFVTGLWQHVFGHNQTHTDPIAGYGGVWLGVDEVHVTTIAVAPIHRRRGIGELLLNGLIDYGLDADAMYMTLEVRVSNLPAQHLYLKYGFRPVGERKRYYTDNGENALIMSTDSIRTTEYQERLTYLRQQLVVRLRAQVAVAGTDNTNTATTYQSQS